MKLLNSSDVRYKVKLASDFLVDANFIYLYQPLLGSKGVMLYQLLSVEARNLTDEFQKIDRLKDLTTYDREEISHLLDKLELIGLLKSYVSGAKENELVFVIEKPLTVRQFKRNEQLMSLLNLKSGEETVEVNMHMLSKSTFEYNGEYEEVSGEFSMEIDTTPLNKFSFEPIKQMLEVAEIELSFWNDDFEKELLEVIIMDDLTNLDVVRLISESLDSDNQFNMLKFKTISVKDGVNEQIDVKIDQSVTSSWEAKLRLISEIDPRHYFEIQFEREATKEERAQLRSMSKTTKLPKEFINLIIDFIALKQGVYVVAYAEKIVKTIKERDIKNVEQLRTWLAAGAKMNVLAENQNKVMNIIDSYEDKPSEELSEEEKIKF